VFILQRSHLLPTVLFLQLQSPSKLSVPAGLQGDTSEASVVVVVVVGFVVVAVVDLVVAFSVFIEQSS